ncbi:MAG TPA: hypothetical protein VGO87_08965 [Acidimicrobiia bacterium]|jgi:molybdopterin converting factor small subunit
MTVSVRIPHGLAWAVGGQHRVDVDGSTLGEVWSNLHAAHPELMRRLSAADSTPSFWIRVTIDGHACAHPTRLETPLRDGADVALHILPGSGVAAGAASGRPPAAAACGATRG